MQSEADLRVEILQDDRKRIRIKDGHIDVRVKFPDGAADGAGDRQLLQLLIQPLLHRLADQRVLFIRIRVFIIQITILAALIMEILARVIIALQHLFLQQRVGRDDELHVIAQRVMHRLLAQLIPHIDARRVMIFQPIVRDDDVADILVKVRQKAEVLSIGQRLIDGLNAGDPRFQLQFAQKQLEHVRGHVPLAILIQDIPVSGTIDLGVQALVRFIDLIEHGEIRAGIHMILDAHGRIDRFGGKRRQPCVDDPVLHQLARRVLPDQRSDILHGLVRAGIERKLEKPVGVALDQRLASAYLFQHAVDLAAQLLKLCLILFAQRAFQLFAHRHEIFPEILNPHLAVHRHPSFLKSVHYSMMSVSLLCIRQPIFQLFQDPALQPGHLHL